MSNAFEGQRFCGTCCEPVKAGREVCPRCGNVIGETVPPLLQAELVSPFGDEPEAGIQKGTSASFSLGTLLIAITILGVLLGITVAAPGLGIPLSLLAVPPAIRTCLVVWRRKDGGLKTSGSEKTALFLMSAFVTWVIVICLIGSCCLTFCGACLGGYALSGGRMDEGMAMLFAGCCTAVVAILVLWAFSHWIRNRWRRDVSK